MLIALLLAAAAAPDFMEQQLVDRCGVAVPRQAVTSYAGDLVRVLHDDSLGEAQTRCIDDWARDYPTAGLVMRQRARNYAFHRVLRERCDRDRSCIDALLNDPAFTSQMLGQGRVRH